MTAQTATSGEGAAGQKGLRADAPEPEVAADKADDVKKPAAAAKDEKTAESSEAATTPQKAAPSSEKNVPTEK